MSLPRLDFSALTHNAAKWPLPAKVVLGCALAGLVLWVGDGMYLSPSRERLQGIDAQGVVSQRQVAEKAGLAAGMASNIVPCVGLIIFTLLVAKLPEE